MNAPRKRFSIFTPTHNPRWLKRLAASLKKQTFTDFDWHIIANGTVNGKDTMQAVMKALGMKKKYNFGTVLQLPDGLTISIHKYTGKTHNIGEIKNWSCARCSGEILVEVDHDDELTPNALEELDKAFTQNSAIDFVYSNHCDVAKDGTPVQYDIENGWEYAPFTYNGSVIQECKSWDPTPHSIAKVWYAPNHIRAWKASFYNEIGGHDKSMERLDDQELLIRTYLKGTMHRIDQPLYIYHFHDDNAHLGKHNAQIQADTLGLHANHFEDLMKHFCKNNGLQMIDLCGGHGKPEGYTSIDLKNADIIADLDGPWPLGDNSVGLIRAVDSLEHLKNPQHTMKEIYRVLVHGGALLSLTPSTDGRGAFQDPTHVSFWNRNSFFYYTLKDINAYIDCPVRFMESYIEDFYPTDYHKMHKISYVRCDLVAVKDGPRLPGLLLI